MCPRTHGIALSVAYSTMLSVPCSHMHMNKMVVGITWETLDSFYSLTSSNYRGPNIAVFPVSETSDIGCINKSIFQKVVDLATSVGVFSRKPCTHSQLTIYTTVRWLMNGHPQWYRVSPQLLLYALVWHWNNFGYTLYHPHIIEYEVANILSI